MLAVSVVGSGCVAIAVSVAAFGGSATNILGGPATNIPGLLPVLTYLRRRCCSHAGVARTQVLLALTGLREKTVVIDAEMKKGPAGPFLQHAQCEDTAHKIWSGKRVMH
ncbi:hypothetical protein [Achromobacter ruhlandii]|uniref:hypothetical protein n=1 Tax=Achromobacter ruhlandii TaxID=72557 RepID=UPI0015837214|nr:hypothetical protein [Achromobacter ruhlandii]